MMVSMPSEAASMSGELFASELMMEDRINVEKSNKLTKYLMAFSSYIVRLIRSQIFIESSE
jgi:hypothetical protein